MIKGLRKINLYLAVLSFWKIPLLFYCHPRIISLDSKSIEVKIKLRRRVKNHLGSMYLGALTIGADITSGYFAFHVLKKKKKKISLIFKDFHANFHKRAMADVVFRCDMGKEISKMIDSAIESGNRCNLPVTVTAKTPTRSNEIVASFILTLSVKVK